MKKELSEIFGTDVIDPEKPFEMVIGGTRYEVSCHFDPEGSRSIWDQFRDLIFMQEKDTAQN